MNEPITRPQFDEAMWKMGLIGGEYTDYKEIAFAYADQQDAQIERMCTFMATSCGYCPLFDDDCNDLRDNIPGGECHAKLKAYFAREKDDLDNYITGHYGEDQFIGECKEPCEMIEDLNDQITALNKQLATLHTEKMSKAVAEKVGAELREKSRMQYIGGSPAGHLVLPYLEAIAIIDAHVPNETSLHN